MYTPKQITTEISDFCESELSNEQPFYVDVNPKSAIGRCFQNVAQHVRNNQGEAVLGWQIWHIPNRFIEGECHCIWKSGDGEYLDITKKADGEKRILFVLDPSLDYNNKLIPNRRMGIDPNDRLVNLFIEFGEKKEELNSKHLNPEGYPETPIVELAKIDMAFSKRIKLLIQAGHVSMGELRSLGLI